LVELQREDLEAMADSADYYARTGVAVIVALLDGDVTRAL
jgi:hypothetical protein